MAKHVLKVPSEESVLLYAGGLEVPEDQAVLLGVVARAAQEAVNLTRPPADGGSALTVTLELSSSRKGKTVVSKGSFVVEGDVYTGQAPELGDE